MQITISRSVLTDALVELAPIAGKNKTFKIFDNIKFVTKGNRIRLQTSDSETTFRKYVEAESIDQDGSFLVDCASLSAFVGKTKGDFLDLILDGNTLTVKHSKGKASFQTLPAEDFIDPPQDEDSTEVAIPAQGFASLVSVARNFVDSEDFRPVMKPIRAIIANGELTICATDTRKMFFDTIPLGTDTPDTQWFVEPMVFSALVAVCKGKDDCVVKVSSKNVSYRIGPTTIFTRQTQGKYPDCKRVIPQSHKIDIVCEKSDIIDAAQRAILFTEKGVDLLKISVSTLSMDIQAENLTKLSKASETLSCTSSDEIIFGASASILMECIRACGASEITMELNDPSRPIVFKDTENTNRVVLCMPMSITRP